MNDAIGISAPPPNFAALQAQPWQQQQQQQPNVAHMAASPRVEALASGLGAAQGGVFGAIVVMPLDMVASKQACGDGAPVASVAGPPRPCAQPPAAKLPCEQPAPE
jgi:hypothetical protein